MRKVGPFILGPQFSKSPCKCVANYLARKDGTDEFYNLKVLTLPHSPADETIDDVQGKMLLYTELSLLRKLKGCQGVIQEHGFFQDQAGVEIEIGGSHYTTSSLRERRILVLDCYTQHDFSINYSNLVNLQQYVIAEKRLPEILALKIFRNVVKVVEMLHKKNIVHRDLKLDNVVLHRDTLQIKVTNLGFGKELASDDEPLVGQQGSPAYASPEVISRKPYLGKPSDMWALGVVLYTMLYNQFPFYDTNAVELFRKIKGADFQITMEHPVSPKTVQLIQELLTLDPLKRISATQTLNRLRDLIVERERLCNDSDLQVVPESVRVDFYWEPQSSYVRTFVKDIASCNQLIPKLSEYCDRENDPAKVAALKLCVTAAGTVEYKDIGFYCPKKVAQRVTPGTQHLMSNCNVVKSAQRNAIFRDRKCRAIVSRALWRKPYRNSFSKSGVSATSKLKL